MKILNRQKLNTRNSLMKKRKSKNKKQQQQQQKKKNRKESELLQRQKKLRFRLGILQLRTKRRGNNRK